MSQAGNKVNWCINKSKKELEEGTQHRGLVEIVPNLNEAKKHLKKAEHNFKAISIFEKSGLADWSVSAVFYTIYHCFLAIITKFGYESRNQECTIALIEYLKELGKIEMGNEIIESLKSADVAEKQETSAIDLRENFQYGTATEVDDKQLSKLKDLCKKAIDATKKILY
jgi:uncharacterized protein (UPF0332 family)